MLIYLEYLKKNKIMPTLTRYTRASFFGPRGLMYSLFSMRNKPTEGTFKKLFQSIGFITEADDTSTTTKQGFVKLALDTDITSRDSTPDTDNMSKVVRPHQIPIVDVKGGNNALSLNKVTDGTGRTGGDGDTYIIENTMAITSDSDVITVTQVAGENAVLDIDDIEFSNAVLSSTAYITLNNKVDTNIVALKQGLIGEIKMYGFPAETLGDTNCEFDANGIGRAAGVEGATGQWEGYVLLLGQIASNIICNTTTIRDRLTISTFLPNTKKSYATGLDKTDSGYNNPFKSVGGNTATLSAAQIPNKVHSHENDISSSIPNPGGAHLHTIITTLDGGGSGSMINRLVDGDSSKGKILMAKTGGLSNLEDGANEGAHDHTIEISGGVLDNDADASTPSHENRPLSFVTCFAMYMDAVPSIV